MCRMIVLNLTVWFFLFGGTVTAGTIYTWTDADGVKRYSNSQPPEDAENVQTIDEIQYDQRGDDQRRQEYNRMVERASKSADRHFEEQAREKERQAEARQQREQDARDQQLEKARAELLKQIDDLQKRGYSATFTKGMKENLINGIQEKIDQLENNAGN
jgi:acyl-CoA reductase-like NAD-dependent aldehyde dehydrogenase